MPTRAPILPKHLLGLGGRDLYNSFWIGVRYLVVSLAGLAMTIAFARLGNPQLFGEYQVLIAIFSIFSILSIPGLNLVALKGIVDDHPEIVRRVVRTSFRTSLLALPLFIMYGGWLFIQGKNFEFLVAFLVGALVFPFFYAPNTWYTVYEGKSQFSPVSKRIMAQTFAVSILLILAIAINAPLWFLVLVYFGGTSVFHWYYYFESLSQVGRDVSEIDLDIRYGWWVTIQKFFLSLGDNVPALILPLLFGLTGFAMYQTAFLFFSAIAGFVAGLSALYLPSLFKGAGGVRQKTILQQLYMGLLAFIVLRICIEAAFLFFYGTDYQSALEIARGLSWLAVFLPFRTYLINFLTAEKKQVQIIIAYALANALSILTLWILRHSSLEIASISYAVVLQTSLVISLLIYARFWKPFQTSRLS